MITTFLLLRSLSSSRPQVTNTELPPGSAFNVALRTMASKEGFQTQWFGWQQAPSATVDSNSTPDTLVWVINWQDTSTAEVLASPGDFQATMGDLAHYFQIPAETLDNRHMDAEEAASEVLMVQWCSGNALKILNWTNRIVLLHVRPQSDNPQQIQQDLDDTAEPEWMACGQVIFPITRNVNRKAALVEMQSISAQHTDDVELYQDWQPFSAVRPRTEVPQDFGSSFAVSLTRTRWCTKIKEGLMETIKANRVY